MQEYLEVDNCMYITYESFLRHALKKHEKSGACVFDATNHGLPPVQEHQSLRNALGPHPLHLYHHHHHNYILHTVLYFSHNA